MLTKTTQAGKTEDLTACVVIFSSAAYVLSLILLPN